MADDTAVGNTAVDMKRVGRLRNPERLHEVNPERVWEVLAPVEEGTIVDIGAGVGFVTLPFARRFPRARVLACDIIPGMLELLGEAARAEGLGNIEMVKMEEARVPLPDSSADLIIMLQVHHELSDPPPLLADCHRLLKSGGTLAIIDWKGEDPEKGTPLEGRVPEGVIREQLAAAGFTHIAGHPIYERHNFLTAGK